MAITEWNILKDRFLRTDQNTRLKSLALNLARLQLVAHGGTDEAVARHLIRESQLLIEWTVPRLNLETDTALATDLVNLQRSLSRWKLDDSDWWRSEAKRQELSLLAQEWGDRLQPDND